VYEPLRLLLVRVVSYGEEVTYDLINLDTGKKTELGSVELPLAFSPDNRRFFVLDTEFGAELPLSLSIYGMDAGVVGRDRSTPAGTARTASPSPAQRMTTCIGTAAGERPPARA